LFNTLISGVNANINPITTGIVRDIAAEVSIATSGISFRIHAPIHNCLCLVSRWPIES